MKQTKRFFGAVCRDKYPNNTDYVIIEAHTIKEAREIIKRDGLDDLITDITNKKPVEPFTVIGIFK